MSTTLPGRTPGAGDEARAKAAADAEANAKANATAHATTNATAVAQHAAVAALTGPQEETARMPAPRPLRSNFPGCRLAARCSWRSSS